MKKTIVLKMTLVVAILLTASAVSKASVNWTRPVASGDGDWGTSANWDTAPSATTDYTYLGTAASNADIEVTDSETYGYRMVLGHTSSVPPLLTIKNGGTLSQGTYSTGSHSYVGRNSGGDGHMVIEAGGTFSTNAKLYIGLYSGSEGTVDVSGTLDLSGGYGKLCLGESASNGTGYLNILNGGVVILSTFQDTYKGFELSAMSSTSEIDILGTGKMIADGNSLSYAQAIIDSDQVYGNGVLGNVEASYDSVEDETTITAIPLTYTLTVNNGTGDGDYEEDSVNNITADAPATGYVFDAWTGDTAYVANVNSASTTVTMPAGPVSVTATYVLDTYTLTVNNGTGDGSYVMDSVNNITADAPAAGYVFDAWTGDTAYVANVNSASTTVTMPAGPVTVTATYEATTSTWARATASGAGNWNDPNNWDGGVPTATTQEVCTAVSDANLAEIQVTNAQTFGLALKHGNNAVATTSGPLIRIQNGGNLSWGDTSTANSYIGYTSNAQMTIEAGGTLTTGRRLYVGNYTGVTGTLNIAGTLDISGTYGKLYVGNAGTGYVNVNDGGLLKLNQFGSSYNGILIAASSTLDIIGTGKVVCDGNDLSDAEALIAGGRVAGNGVLGDVEASYDSVEDETTITAITTTYTLTVNNGTGDGDYEEDSVNNITADAPAAGYVFDVWTGDTAYVADVDDPNTTVTMPAAAVSVTATYEPVYTLTVTNGTGDGSYIEDSVNNISADTPAAGYVFDAWTGDTAYVADVNDPSTTVTMPAAAVTVTATYELETYALTVTNGTGDGSYVMGSVNAIAADAAASGYVFAEWTGDTAYVTDVDDPTTSVTMPAGAVSVTATYIIENSTWTRAAVSGVGNWSSASNWDEDAAPVAATEYTYTGADANLAEIQVTDTEIYGYRLVHGSASSSSTESPVLRIQIGGALSQGTYDVGKHSFVGRDNKAKMVIEAGGYFSTNAKLYIGMYSGSEGTVDVSGILDLSGGYGKLCFGASATTGTGYLNILDGGIVKLSTFQDTYKGFELSAMSSTSMIDIQGSGKMVCDGDAVGYANAIINAGQIKGDGVLGNVEASYDAIEDETMITVTPDPPSTWARATASGAGNWNDPNNWDEGGVPTSSDETYTAVSDANLAEIQVTDTQTCLVLKHGYNKVATTDGPVIRIQNGGSLSDAASASDSYIGYTSSAQMIVESGGTFTASQKLYVGKNTDVIGIVDIAGTFDISDVNGLLVLGDDGTGYVNVLNGGLLELNSFNGLTIEAGSILDIYGTGEVVADGNSLSAAEALIASDRIAGDGILSNVVASYDSGADETTITVISGSVTFSVWERATTSGAGNWSNSSNWDAGGVPSSSTDETHTAIDANDLAEMQVTNAQTFGLRLFHGNNVVAATEGPVIRIENGGSLSWEDISTANSYIGYNSSAQMIIEDGGTFTTGRKLHLGVYPGVTGTVDISGTMDLTDGLYGGLVLGNGTVGTGIVDVNDGGTLELNSIDSVTISDGSMLDVTGTGEIVIDGNEVSDAEAFIASGHAYGDGILRNLVAVYDPNMDETTITSYPLLTLVEDGDPNIVIVIGADANTPEEYAADELQTYLYKMSGATVSIVTENGTLPSKAIVIGTPDTCQHIADSGLVPESSLSRDGLRIKTVGDILYLAGEYPSGALYATYEFLEHLGCRWYFPGTDGEYVPSMTTITTGRINDTQEPAMEFRGIHVVGDTTKSPEVATWMARNRMNYISQIPFYSYHRSKFEDNIKKGMLCNTETHFSHWLGGGDLFDTHPEYFPLIDGVRVEGFPSGYDPNVLQQHNYCLSNLDLVDEVADAMEDYVELFPEIEIIGINQMDSVDWCECGPCTALGTPTDRLHTFINRLVTELDSRGSLLDNRMLTTQAYLGTDELPVNVTPNEKVIIQYAMVTHCARHGWNENCPSQAFQKDRLDGWLGYGNKVNLYTYHASLCPGFPFPMAYHSLDGMKYYNSIGISGWYPETFADDPGENPWGDPNLLTGDQWYSQKELYYTAAKALWDPNVTLDEIKDDYFPRFYGDAGSAMRDYYDAFEDAWHYPGNVLFPHKRIYGYNPNTVIDFLNPTLINTLNGYLDDAVDDYTGESQVIQDRVDRDVDMFEKWDDRYDVTGGIPSL